MFIELFEKMIDGDTVTIAITRKDVELTVSVLPTKQLKNIKPLHLTGAPEELDMNFAAAINDVINAVKKFVPDVVIHNEDEVTESIEQAGTKIEKKKAADKAIKAKIAAKKAAPEIKVVEAKKTAHEKLVAEIQPLINNKQFTDAIAVIQGAIKTAKGEDAKSMKELLFNTQLAKQKELLNEAESESDEAADVVIPKKMQPNPAVANVTPVVEPERTEDEDDDIPIVDDESNDDFVDNF